MANIRLQFQKLLLLIT